VSLALTRLGEGRPLVLLHGWGMHSGVWAGFAERLAQGRELWLIDLPGHGQSPYDGEASLEEWAHACLAVAPQRALWLGLSLGAQVALQAALQAPGRVAALIALCGTPRFLQADDWLHAMPPETLAQFITASRRDHRRTLERFLALQVRGSERERELLRRLREALEARPDPVPQALASGLELLRRIDLRPQLRELGCPSGWLYGERDTLVPAAQARALGAWLPQAETHRVEQAAHATFLSHEAATLAHLGPLLEAFDAG